jgi:hypothetical protein
MSSLCSTSKPWCPIDEKPVAWREVEVLLENQKLTTAVWRGTKWFSNGMQIEPVSWRPLPIIKGAALWRGLLTRY